MTDDQRGTLRLVALVALFYLVVVVLLLLAKVALIVWALRAMGVPI